MICASRCMPWACSLRSCARALIAPERERVVERIDAAIAAMNELFNALLDISKLDAGVLTRDLKEFPVQHLFDRIETTFAAAAREKG